MRNKITVKSNVELFIKPLIFVLILTSVFTVVAYAGSVAGIWKGESICTIKDSPCHDEQVIYHIFEPDRSGNLKIQADKVVNGVPEEMGTLECQFDSSSSKLVCKMTNGVWDFTVAGDKMTGTLTLTDGRLYRRISVMREK